MMFSNTAFCIRRLSCLSILLLLVVCYAKVCSVSSMGLDSRFNWLKSSLESGVVFRLYYCSYNAGYMYGIKHDTICPPMFKVLMKKTVCLKTAINRNPPQSTGIHRNQPLNLRNQLPENRNQLESTGINH